MNAPTKQRIRSFDLLKGLVIVIMSGIIFITIPTS
jgi:uncharacterized membrane protein